LQEKSEDKVDIPFPDFITKARRLLMESAFFLLLGAIVTLGELTSSV
jgi:hypothetical protein